MVGGQRERESRTKVKKDRTESKRQKKTEKVRFNC